MLRRTGIYIGKYDINEPTVHNYICAYIALGERSSVSIGHNYLIQKRTRNIMNSGGQGC